MLDSPRHLLGTRRVYHQVAVAVATAWLAIMLMAPTVWLRPWPDILLVTDFASYWTGALLVREGAGPHLYDMERQHSLQLELRQTLATDEEIRNDTGYNPYPNPPPLTLAYVPLTFLPMPWAYALWWIVSLAAFLGSIMLLLRRQPLARSKTIILLGFGAVTSTLFEGQPYGLMLLFFTAGLVLLRSGRPFIGGMVLGLLLLKPQYAVLLPVVFLFKRRWAELVGMGVSGLAILAASVAMVGVEGIAKYVNFLLGIGRYQFAEVRPGAMINWRAMLSNMAPGIDEQIGNLLVIGLAATTVAIALFLWKGDWNPQSPEYPLRMLGLMAATILASPHSHFHGGVFLLAPAAIAIAGHGGCCISGPLVRLLAAGYLLAFVTWPAAGLRWLMALYLVVVLLYLAVAARRSEAEIRSPALAP